MLRQDQLESLQIDRGLLKIALAAENSRSDASHRSISGAFWRAELGGSGVIERPVRSAAASAAKTAEIRGRAHKKAGAI